MTSILWVDDDPSFEKYYKRIFNSICKNIRLLYATDLDEAKEYISKGGIHGVISDLNMEESLDYTGAEWIRDISLTEKHIPTFISSGYLNDPSYAKEIEESYVIDKHSKNDVFTKPFADDKFFKKLIYHSRLCESTLDYHPEKIEFSNFQKNPERFEKETRQHWNKFGNWMSMYMAKRKFNWLTMVGDEVISGSHDLNDFPSDEELIKLGEKHNLIPFSYTQIVRPEQIEWRNEVDSDNYYPQINFKFQGDDYKEDFDTGAVISHFSDDIVKWSFINAIREINSGSHLGEKYEGFSKPIDFSLVGACGNILSQRMTVAVVKNWRGSSFTRVYSNRQALIGRDILKSFDVTVKLDGKNRLTIVDVHED